MRQVHLYNRFLLITLAIIAMGCEGIIEPKASQANPRAVFEHLWTDIHNRYSFFEEKQIDWEVKKEIYSPLIYNEMSPFELFDVLGDMLAELEDGHVNLLSTFNRSRNWSWYEVFPLFYDEHLIYDEYLNTDYRIIGSLHAQTVDNMLYVRISSFERKVTMQHMDENIRLMQFHDGLIIDVRSNGGGNLMNALTFVARLTDVAIISDQRGSRN